MPCQSFCTQNVCTVKLDCFTEVLCLHFESLANSSVPNTFVAYDDGKITLLGPSLANATNDDVEFLLAEFDTQQADGIISREEFASGLLPRMRATEDGHGTIGVMRLLQNGKSHEDHYDRTSGNNITQW